METMGVTRTLLGLFALLAGFGTVPAQEPGTPEPPKVAAPKPNDGKEPPEKAVSRLVEQLRLHPAKPSTAEKRRPLYLIDLATGEVTMVADQPDHGLTYCGSSAWSYDGRRILFDATPWTEWSLSRLKEIEIVDGRLTMRDLGLGNCPTFSPAGDRIAFLSNSNANGAELGVWLMQADGSRRRPLGEYGRPRWSPDSRQFMIVSFSKACQVTLMDVRPEKSGPLRVPGQNLYSVPSWTGPGTIVTVMGSDAGDTIALLDINDPAEGKVKEIFWKRANGPDLTPSFPLYSAITRRCTFVGGGPKGMALYSFQVGKSEPPRRLEPEGYDQEIADLASSPDGRFVLFASDRPGRRPAGGAAGSKEDAGIERRKSP
jgi:Tol biopolymer transport system component